MRLPPMSDAEYNALWEKVLDKYLRNKGPSDAAFAHWFGTFYRTVPMRPLPKPKVPMRDRVMNAAVRVCGFGFLPR